MNKSSSTQLWRWTSLISACSLLLFAVGFILALNPHVLHPAPPPSPSAEEEVVQPQTSQLHIVSLGDSLTRGTGDAVGLGYIGRFREQLEASAEESIQLTNLAINGLQSPELLTQLQQTNVRRLIQEADVISFTIGGNDLFRQSQGVYELSPEKTDSIIEILAVNFERILTELREINQTAPILYVSLYNPFGDTEAATEIAGPIQKWNYKAAQIAAKFANISVVPTYDLFAGKEEKYLYTDHFHPNSDGYARIAERVWQAYQ